MAETAYDVVVIGGGPGGYVAAIKCAQLGLKTACVEKRKTLGGTCLNVGCIPSKALLNASHHYAQVDHLKEFGVEVGAKKLNLKQMLSKKESIVSDLTKGIDFLFKKNKVDRFVGQGTLKDAQTVVVSPDGKEIKAKNIIIATGSKSAGFMDIDLDEKTLVSSTGALSLSEVPKKMVVIGGGYIGLEMASVWSRLGSAVTVVEYAETIVPMMDQEVASALLKSLKRQGLEFKLGTKVTQVEKAKKGATLSLESGDGKQETLKADVVLVAIGRTPNTDGLGLEALGIKKDSRGFVQVNVSYQTAVPTIYAIGDVIPGPMLAHKAEEEGVAVAEILVGQAGHVNYDAIPSVIYTSPEVASVGKTEEELKKQGEPYKVGKFPFTANSRAKALSETEGFVKILTHAETDRVLGVHIISADAGTLIAEAVLGLEYKCSAEDIARTCHAHPTTSEALKEAALAAFFKPIHG